MDYAGDLDRMLVSLEAVLVPPSPVKKIEKDKVGPPLTTSAVVVLDFSVPCDEVLHFDPTLYPLSVVAQICESALDFFENGLILNSTF